MHRHYPFAVRSVRKTPRSQCTHWKRDRGEGARGRRCSALLLAGALRRTSRIIARLAARTTPRYAAADTGTALVANRVGAGAIAQDAEIWVLPAAELWKGGIRADRIAHPVDTLLAVTAARKFAQTSAGRWVADLLALFAPAFLGNGSPLWRALQGGPADQRSVVAELFLTITAERGERIGAALVLWDATILAAKPLAGTALVQGSYARPVRALIFVRTAIVLGLTLPIRAHSLAGTAERLADARAVRAAFPAVVRAVMRAESRWGLWLAFLLARLLLFLPPLPFRPRRFVLLSLLPPLVLPLRLGPCLGIHGKSQPRGDGAKGASCQEAQHRPPGLSWYGQRPRDTIEARMLHGFVLPSLNLNLSWRRIAPYDLPPS